MASNYSNLKEELISFTGRNDIDGFIDTAINICESRIYANPTSPLRLRSMEIRATATLDTASRFLALPDDFLSMRRLKIQLSGGDVDVRYMTPEQLGNNGTSGIPRHFTVSSQIEFDRVPDSAYTIEMQYFGRLTALDDTNTTNDIITNYPEIYLYGCLSVLNEFEAEEDKASYYYNKFLESLAGANKQDKRGRYGSSPVMRTEGSTP